MKTVDTKAEPKWVNFRDMSGGELFYLFYLEERPNVFMVLSEPIVSEDKTTFNAVSLANGDLVEFEGWDVVCPIEAELVLKRGV